MTNNTNRNIEEVRENIKKYKRALVALIKERDRLVIIECKNLEAKHMEYLGEAELDFFKTEWEFRKKRRMLQILKDKVCYNEPIDLDAVDKQIDGEFSSYGEKYEKKANRHAELKKWLENGIQSEEDAEKAMAFHERVIWALHPELHPNRADDDTILFLHALIAFDQGDLDTLKTIAEAVIIPETDDMEEASMEDLLKEETRIMESIQNIDNEITVIKGKAPYTEKAMLDDKNAMEGHKNMLLERIGKIKEETKSFDEKIAKALVGTYMN